MKKIVSILQYGLPIFLFGQTHLQDVTSWAYQLQDIDIQAVADNNTFELVVLDYSADGSDEERFTEDQIQQIKDSGKNVMAYISIGEAEDYRFYWQVGWDADGDGIPDPAAPEWLGNENPDWGGNYKVRFWYSGWQDIVFSYIDRIIAQGFDGIYCDIIDAYYFWSEENREKPDADALMIRFIQNIRQHIDRTTTTPFFILPQNGEFLIVEDDVTDDLRQTYLDAIQGIGVEDIFFIGEKDENNPYDPDAERIEIVEDYADAGIPVFSVEYLTEAGLIQQYRAAAEAEGYIPYAARRELDTLNDGIGTYVSPGRPHSPRNFSLLSNYPNPFNAQTTLLADLPESAVIRLSILDSRGVLQTTVFQGPLEAGNHAFAWHGRNHRGDRLPSGSYRLLLQTGDRILSQHKILLIK